MRLFLLTALTMTAFAANSVLTRAALVDAQIGAGAFAFWRVFAGAVVLALLVLMRDRRLPIAGPGRVAGVVGLSVYLIGFSYAYLRLDTGLGALILFGGVQVAMFVAAVAMREPIPATRWAGAAIAFAGLLVLLLPGVQGGADDALALALMLAAAIGWAGYTLAGRKATDALQATAANFLLSVPVVLAAVLLVPAGIATATATTPTGLALALVSGGVTSGLGYALWFRVLPRLDRTIAAVAQLTAPVIAAAGGIALIGERPGWDFALATLLVLGGVLLSLRKPAT